MGFFAIVEISQGDKKFYTIKRLIESDVKVNIITDIIELEKDEPNIVDESSKKVENFWYGHYHGMLHIGIIDQLKFVHYKYTDGFANLKDITIRRSNEA